MWLLVPHKKYRFEANNPYVSTDWDPLFEIDEEELLASQQLRDELNEMNSQVVLRIVESRSNPALR